MIKKIILAVFLFSVIFPIFHNVEARSGCCSHHNGVRGDGCGCNDGSPLSSTCAPYYSCKAYEQTPIYIPQPTPIIIPTYINGGSTYDYNNFTKTYNVSFTWDDWSSSSGWSIGISSYAGADPGPNIDTTTTRWTFENVSSGRKYINVKASVSGYWSRVSYWTIDVPPLPTSTPIPTYTPTPIPTLKISLAPIKNSILSNHSNSQVNNRANQLSINFLDNLSSFWTYLYSLIPKSVNNNSPIKQNLIIPTILPTPTLLPTLTPTIYISEFKCNCSKTCSQITSCDEAYYQLNNCGCTVRDGDHDGIPCDSMCQK